MKPTPDIRQRLTAIGAAADHAIDIAGAALALAVVRRPDVALEPYRRHLDKLAREVGQHAGRGAETPIETQIEALREVVAKRYGYIGAEDAFDDPEAANLTRVIDRRSGLPVALGIIYIHAAKAQDWTLAGVDFPARFLLRIEHQGQRVILDPFDGLRALGAVDMRALFKAIAGSDAELSPAHYRVMTPREVLLRLQNNIKARLLQARQLEDALDVIETMLLIAPNATALWRESGLLNARLDNVKAAVAALEEFMRRESRDTSRYRTSVLLQELRGRLN